LNRSFGQFASSHSKVGSQSHYNEQTSYVTSSIEQKSVRLVVRSNIERDEVLIVCPVFNGDSLFKLSQRIYFAFKWKETYHLLKTLLFILGKEFRLSRAAL